MKGHSFCPISKYQDQCGQPPLCHGTGQTRLHFWRVYVDALHCLRWFCCSRCQAKEYFRESERKTTPGEKPRGEKPTVSVCTIKYNFMWATHVSIYCEDRLNFYVIITSPTIYLIDWVYMNYRPNQKCPPPLHNPYSLLRQNSFPI